MAPSGIADRIARHDDRRVDAACAVRPTGTTYATAIGAGLGAGVGSIALGGPIYAGLGAGSASSSDT